MAIEELIQELVSRKKIGLTTIRRTDQIYGSRLRTAIDRGTDELVQWGLGPDLRVTDIVALYISDNKSVLPQNRKNLARLYFVAGIIPIPFPMFRNRVFLHHCVEIEPLTYSELLSEPFCLKPREIYKAGSIKEPWSKERCWEFWSLVLGRQPNLEKLIRWRLLEASLHYDVSLSYAGEDWKEANRLKSWLDEGGWKVFFATSTGELNFFEENPLQKLLGKVYANAKVAVFLVPRSTSDSKWVQIERQAAFSSLKDNDIVFLRTDSSRKWPTEAEPGSSDKRVTRMEYKPPNEEEVFKEIKKLLSRKETHINP